MRQQAKVVSIVAIFLYFGGSTCTGLDLPEEDVELSAPLGAHRPLRQGAMGMKRAVGGPVWEPALGTAGDLNWKRAPNGLGRAGFHGDVFNQGFGAFSPVKRTLAALRKRRPEMDASGFYGDTFNGGMGYFDTMKRRPEMDASGFYGDTFNGGLGYFDTMKRRPEMDASGFYGDTFSNGFGLFDTMKRQHAADKRRPEMDSSGFHGDVFSSGFGYFDTMKRQLAATVGAGRTDGQAAPPAGRRRRRVQLVLARPESAASVASGPHHHPADGALSASQSQHARRLAEGVE